MSKVGILTFHYADNCGAQLQLTAMYNFLIEAGYEPEVIDYRSKILCQRNAVVQNPFFRAKMGWRSEKSLKRKLYKMCGGIYYAFYSYLKMPKLIKEKQSFKSYYKNHPLMKSNRVFGINDLEKMSQGLSHIIVGSDQVWNTDLYNGFQDDVYFLKSKSVNCVKVGYAVSAGNLLKADEDEIQSIVENFDWLSARESQLAEQLEKASGLTIPTVLDPVFLQTRDVWNQLCGKGVMGDYIFLYVLENNPELLRILQKIKMTMNVNVVEVGFRKRYPESILVNQLDPGVFLRLIRDAKYVISNSFHATAFSIIFEKDFYTLRHSTRNHRMESLLEKVGLLDRCISSADEIKPGCIDYEAVNNNLNKEITKSKDYLIHSLTGENLYGEV